MFLLHSMPCLYHSLHWLVSKRVASTCHLNSSFPLISSVDYSLLETPRTVCSSAFTFLWPLLPIFFCRLPFFHPIFLLYNCFSGKLPALPFSICTLSHSTLSHLFACFQQPPKCWNSTYSLVFLLRSRFKIPALCWISPNECLTGISNASPKPT